jgi:hypothetical protein
MSGIKRFNTGEGRDYLTPIPIRSPTNWHNTELSLLGVTAQVTFSLMLFLSLLGMLFLSAASLEGGFVELNLRTGSFDDLVSFRHPSGGGFGVIELTHGPSWDLASLPLVPWRWKLRAGLLWILFPSSNPL